jgi:hypothetical protein
MKFRIPNYEFRTFVILIILSLFLFYPANAAVVGSTGDPMTIGGGARPIGMGRAFTAVADDADAPFLNPAGIAGLKGPQYMAMFTNLLEDIYYKEYCAAIPTPNGTFGFGYISTGVNGIPTPISSTEIVNTDYYDSLFLLSYSTPLARYLKYGNNVFMGINLKVFSRGYTGGYNAYASGFSSDFGLKVILSPNLSLGVSAQNFLPVSLGGVVRLSSGAEESLAGITKVGIAARPKQFDRKLLIAFDTDIPSQSGRPLTSHLGIEYKPIEYLAIRAGADQSVDAATAVKTSWSPSYGVSLGYSGLRVDYAYHPYYNDAALASSYVSLSYIGDPWYAMRSTIE